MGRNTQKMKNPSRRKLYAALCEETRNCLKCPALADRVPFLNRYNGSLTPKVFFVAEAPGRIGTEEKRQPFSDSKSGANFQKFIDSINLRRTEIFISNAALCNPQTATGANRKPSKREVANCSDFLRKQFDLLDAKIIVTLGSVALEALKTIEYHQYTLRQNAATILRWNGRILVPLYHPSPQVTASHRRVPQQLEDYQALAEAIKIFAAQN